MIKNRIELVAFNKMYNKSDYCIIIYFIAINRQHCKYLKTLDSHVFICLKYIIPIISPFKNLQRLYKQHEE